MRGDGRTLKRGNKWWIFYYAPENGKSKEQREPGGSTEAEARLLRPRLREIAVHRSGLRPFQGPRQERVTVDELLQQLEKDTRFRAGRDCRSCALT